jgi:hypothetical protein
VRNLDLIVDGLYAAEYWDHGTELDLPRRNGQVLLPEDDASVWRHAWSGDEENAINQLRAIRDLRRRLEAGTRRRLGRSSMSHSVRIRELNATWTSRRGGMRTEVVSGTDWEAVADRERKLVAGDRLCLIDLQEE